MGASATGGRCGRVGTSGRRSAPRPRDSGVAAVLAAGSAAGSATAVDATSDVAVAGSAAAPVIAACAERWSGTGASGVDDAKTGASAGAPGKVCAPAAQATQAETMQTSEESDAEQFMTNRTEYVR